jgi:hypothetical protein
VDSATGLEVLEPWSAASLPPTAAAADASSSSASDSRLRLTNFFFDGFLKAAISSWGRIQLRDVRNQKYFGARERIACDDKRKQT